MGSTLSRHQELACDKALQFALRIEATYGDEAQLEEQVFAWVREHYPAMAVRFARMIARHVVHQVRRRKAVDACGHQGVAGPVLTGPAPGL